MKCIILKNTSVLTDKSLKLVRILLFRVDMYIRFHVNLEVIHILEKQAWTWKLGRNLKPHFMFATTVQYPIDWE